MLSYRVDNITHDINLEDYMKTIITLVAACGLMLIPATLTQGQEQEQIIIRETLNGSFGKVWNGIRVAMREFGCDKPQTEKVIEPAEEGGFYRGLYISDFCVKASGEDTTMDVISRYGKLPKIRGGIYVSFRVQWKINVKEEERGKSSIIMKCELSAFEEFITNSVHFFNSNGILEQQMLEMIKTAVAAGLRPDDDEEG